MKGCEIIKKNIFFMSCLILLIFVSLGCANKIKTETVASPVINTVQSYLKAGTQLDWNLALVYLTGEALHNAKSNISLVELKSSIKEQSYKVALANDKISAVEALMVLETNNLLEIVHDRYFLINDDGWKIYRQESIPVILPESLETVSEDLKSLEDVIKGYLQYVANGQYRESLQYLTGQELATGQRFVNIKPLKQDLQLSNYEVLGINDRMAFIKAEISSENTRITKLFEMIHLDGQWKIHKSTNL